jgi:sugar O-acyltransferase (sialic acid O-acetyltransferase NeuD family)
MSRVLIIGGGDLAKQINHYILTYDENNEVVGFVDDTVSPGVERFGRNCLGGIRDIENIAKNKGFDKLVLGIGYKHLERREEIFNRFYKNYPFYTFVHPRAFVDNSAVIGSGVIIGPNCVIEQRAKIEDNVFIYNSVSISHDSIVGGHSFIAPTVSIAGFVHIGSCCFLGINATVIDNIRITGNVIVGANSLVVKGIDEPGTYIGQPCKKIIAQ